MSALCIISLDDSKQNYIQFDNLAKQLILIGIENDFGLHFNHSNGIEDKISKAIAFLLYRSISMITYYISFNDKGIYVPNQKAFKIDRIQFKDEILYSKIADVRVKKSMLNSKKKPCYYWGSRHSWATFFEFELENGKKKWVYISFFSKKQRIRMLEIINERTGLTLCYDQMLKESKPVTKSKSRE